MDDDESGGGPSDTEGYIELPISLASPPKADKPGDSAKASRSKKTKATTPETNRPAKKASTPSAHHARTEQTNGYAHPAWLVPSGVDYLSLFENRAPGTKNWPKFVDPRLPKRNGQSRATPLCVRFQMTGRCTHGCSLAHVLAKPMSEPEFQQTDKLV